MIMNSYTYSMHLVLFVKIWCTSSYISYSRVLSRMTSCVTCLGGRLCCHLVLRRPAFWRLVVCNPSTFKVKFSGTRRRKTSPIPNNYTSSHTSKQNHGRPPLAVPLLDGDGGRGQRSAGGGGGGGGWRGGSSGCAPPPVLEINWNK